MVVLMNLLFGLMVIAEDKIICTGNQFQGRPAKVQLTAQLDATTSLVSDVTFQVDGQVVIRSPGTLPRRYDFNNRNNIRYRDHALHILPTEVFQVVDPERFRDGMLWFPLVLQLPVDVAYWSYRGTASGDLMRWRWGPATPASPAETPKPSTPPFSPEPS